MPAHPPVSSEPSASVSHPGVPAAVASSSSGKAAVLRPRNTRPAITS